MGEHFGKLSAGKWFWSVVALFVIVTLRLDSKENLRDSKLMLDLLGALFVISIVMVLFGIDQIFTVKYGEKWYPGLSSALWKIPEDVSFKLIFGGVVLFLITIFVGGLLKV